MIRGNPDGLPPITYHHLTASRLCKVTNFL